MNCKACDPLRLVETHWANEKELKTQSNARSKANSSAAVHTVNFTVSEHKIRTYWNWKQNDKWRYIILIYVLMVTLGLQSACTLYAPSASCCARAKGTCRFRIAATTHASQTVLQAKRCVRQTVCLIRCRRTRYAVHTHEETVFESKFCKFRLVK